MSHLNSVEIVNEGLALTGATINGEAIDIEANEISITPVMD